MKIQMKYTEMLGSFLKISKIVAMNLVSFRKIMLSKKSDSGLLNLYEK